MSSFLPPEEPQQYHPEYLSEPQSEYELIQLSKTPDVIRSCVNQCMVNRSKKRPYSLLEVKELKIQQALVIKDLLFVLLGYEGFYIRYSEKYNQNSPTSLIRGPDFKTAKHLDISIKSLTKKLVYFGKYYAGLSYFIQIYCRAQYGKVIQRFCLELLLFLASYRQLIIQIEQEFKSTPSFNLTLLENFLSSEVMIQIGLFYEISIQIDDISRERQNILVNDEQYFTNFIHNIQNGLNQTGRIDLATDESSFSCCKGGLALQIIQKLSKQYLGDQMCYNFLNELFDSISIDYTFMLNDWLQNGEIDDPFDEFFIKVNKIKQTEIFHPKTEKYWDEVYVTRTDGLINQFIDSDIQHKILSTGKFLNIFKLCTGISSFESLDEPKLSPISKLSSANLELMIQQYYSRANKYILNLFFEGYGFCQTINTLQKSLLLSDSSNIDNFLSKSFNDLRKNYHNVSITKLTYSFASAFDKGPKSYDDDHHRHHLEDQDPLLSSKKLLFDQTDFYQLAKEILSVKSFDAVNAIKTHSGPQVFKELLNKSLDRSKPDDSSSSNSNSDDRQQQNTYHPDHSDEYTISHVNLDFQVPFPLNIIITQSFAFEYQLMFKLIILTKFISKLITNTWKEINYSSVWNHKGYGTRMKKWILRSRILHSRVNNFMNEINFYINSDIIEVNFSTLNKYVKDISRTLILETELEIHHPSDSETSEFKDVIGKFPDRFTGSSTRASPFLRSHSQLETYNQANNSIFDRNIQATSQTHAGVKDMVPDYYKLQENLGIYLNSILRDCLITNGLLIESMKKIFDTIILYNHYLGRLKKSLITMNGDLFDKFSNEYPEKFSDTSMDDDSVRERFRALNDGLNSYYQGFNEDLEDFITVLRRLGESDNNSLLVLVQKLENSFPN